MTPILHSLHWLKIKESIEYKLLWLTLKFLQTLNHVCMTLSVQPTLPVALGGVTTVWPPSFSSLQIRGHCYWCAPESASAWSQLSNSFRQPYPSLSNSNSHMSSYHVVLIHHSQHPSLIHFFTRCLKTNMFHKLSPPWTAGSAPHLLH